MRTTHTFVELEVSPAAYREIRAKLLAADYGHCFDIGDREQTGTGPIDMTGIAVIPAPYTRCGACGAVVREVGPGNYECDCSSVNDQRTTETEEES